MVGVNCEETDDDSAETDVRDDDMDPNDSVTKLNQLASSIEEIHVIPKTAKSNNSNSDHQMICPELCKIKTNSKKHYDMTRCSLCVVWFHDKCVGLGKNEPVGLWLCPSCRNIPRGIQNGVINLKHDNKSLKESTESIPSAVQGLSTKFEACIGGINDRLTSLSKQMNTKDKSVTGSLESLTSSTNNIKTVLDQKSNQILNKTSAVLDKLKSQADAVDKTIQQSKSTGKPEVEQSKETSKPKHGDNYKIPETIKVAQSKPKYILPVSEQQTSKPKISEALQTSDANLEHETIDLTVESKKRITQSTLLVGSSLLKGVRVSDLRPGTTVRSFSGARADTIREKLSKYNIDDCKTIILHVGGNDPDDGVD